MSITGFQDAIADQVGHYDDTIKTLRENTLFNRSTALAGIQSEVEKYGEIAKLGLEFPLAIEGLKAVGKTTRAGFNALTKGKDVLSAGKDAMDTIKDQLSGGAKGLAARAKGKLGGITNRPNIPTAEEMESRFDSLKLKSGFTPNNSIIDIKPSEISTGGISTGESKEGMESFVKTKVEGMKSKTTFGMDGEDGKTSTELPATDDFENSNSLLDPNPYGQLNAEDNTSIKVPLDATGGTESTSAPVSAPEIQEDAPVQRFLGRKDVARPNPKPQAEPEAPEAPESVMPTEMELSDTNYSGPTMIRQDSRGYNDPESSLAGLESEAEAGPSISKTIGSNIGKDIGSTAEKISGEGSSFLSKLGLGGDASSIEEGLGGLFDATGIFAPLGVLLEGLGAVTEVASVGAGAYGAVQSMIDTGKEEALRAQNLPPVNPGNLDVGGSIAAPELA